jgi:hypothetical protein
MEITEETANKAYEQGYEDAKTTGEDTPPTEYQSKVAEYRQQQEETFNIFRLQSEDWIDRIGHELRGEVPEVTENNGMQSLRWVQRRKAQLNEDGIQLAMSVLSMYANKDSYLTYLDEPTINRICKDVNDELTIEYSVYRKKYGVSNMFLVVDHICNRIMIALRRALKGREADLISKGFNRIEHVSSVSPQQGRGIGRRMAEWLKPKRQ